MRNAVIVEAVRSPMGRGKPGGALSGLHPVELLAQVITGLLDRVPVDPGEVDDVIVGCVSQGGEQSACPGRWAWLAAGLPEHVPATTIDRRCGSSQQAAHFAAQGIMAGVYDIAVVAGVESMSRVPMGSARQNADPFGPTATARYAPGPVPQGVSAELIAARWGLGREQLDAYAARSHSRAAAAAASGEFDREIVPVVVPNDTGPVTVSVDESIRPGTSAGRLSALPASFASDHMARRFPDIDWRITAGNSSQLTDGASAMLLMSENRAAELGITPRARFHAFAVCGTDPIMMLTGPLPVTHKILARCGLKLDEIDHVEVNEAFAPIPLAWQAEFPVRDEILNPRGGAIALGHPLGASGARLMTTMLHALEDRGGRYGLQTMCEGGGMANATIIERL